MAIPDALTDRVRLALANEHVRALPTPARTATLALVPTKSADPTDPTDPTAAQIAAAIHAESGLLGDAAVLNAASTIHRELVGAGPLEPYLAIPGVTDVLVHGPNQVWIDRGNGLERVDARFPDDLSVRRLAQRLASSAGRRLDDATPYVDARLPAGARLHAVLAPVSTRGTCISLRLAARRVFTLDELVAADSLPREGVDLLARMIRARLAFLVTGGTGSGKTTLLTALLSLVPIDERIVIVEDASELAPAHPHVVHLEARPPNLEGAGEITLHTLVRHALRMRPDRLVVGEVRGAEVVSLLAALNTGHEGGCGTLHANSATEVPARIEALGVAAGLNRPAVHSQLAAAVDAVIHLARGRDGRRRIAQICVLQQGSDGLVTAVEAVRFPNEEGPGMPRLQQLLERGEHP
jgi:pilus assembly protein CpaF